MRLGRITSALPKTCYSSPRDGRLMRPAGLQEAWLLPAPSAACDSTQYQSRTGPTNICTRRGIALLPVELDPSVRVGANKVPGDHRGGADGGSFFTRSGLAPLRLPSSDQAGRHPVARRNVEPVGAVDSQPARRRLHGHRNDTGGATTRGKRVEQRLSTARSRAATAVQAAR